MSKLLVENATSNASFMSSPLSSLPVKKDEKVTTHWTLEKGLREEQIHNRRSYKNERPALKRSGRDLSARVNDWSLPREEDFEVPGPLVASILSKEHNSDLMQDEIRRVGGEPEQAEPLFIQGILCRFLTRQLVR